MIPRHLLGRRPGAGRHLALAALAALVSVAPASCAAAPVASGFDEARRALVRSLEASGVRDTATLAALRAVPRHEFVPLRYRELAYADQALPIAEGQTISQPYIVAIMTEAIRQVLIEYFFH